MSSKIVPLMDKIIDRTALVGLAPLHPLLGGGDFWHGDWEAELGFGPLTLFPFLGISSLTTATNVTEGARCALRLPISAPKPRRIRRPATYQRAVLGMNEDGEEAEGAEEVEEAEAGADADGERLGNISKAYRCLDKCMARAYESGGTVEAETPVKRGKISKFTERQFQSRSGPRSRAAQLRVDRRHEALHQANEAGWVQKTLMAFYFKWFAEERQARLALSSFDAEGALSLF